MGNSDSYSNNLNLDFIKEKLINLDWNFPTASKAKGLHTIHPYPAKFIPEIPRNLIQILGLPKDTAILDPFCGSGVTLVEAQHSGLRSIGIDLNPIACLISKVKTTSTPTNFISIAEKCIQNAKDNKNPEIPDIPNLMHWYEVPVQKAVAAILIEIDKLDSEVIKERLRLALSSILVKVSNQESDTRYAAIIKNVGYDQVFDDFYTVCLNIKKYCDASKDAPISIILEQSTLEVNPDSIPLPIGLVITSPPYPNAYEYWLYHKYRMLWLGYDPQNVKNKEIGARAHFFKKNHQTEKDFERQMEKTFNLLQNVVVKGGFVCFIVGRSVIHSKIINNSEIIISIATKSKFKHFITLQRTINRERKSFNLSHARIKEEDILIFQKL